MAVMGIIQAAIAARQAAAKKGYKVGSNPFEVQNFDDVKTQAKYWFKPQNPKDIFGTDPNNSASLINVTTGGWFGANKKKKEADKLNENTNTVAKAFGEILGRAPTAEENQTYINAIYGKQLNSPDDVKNSLMATDEFKTMMDDYNNSMMEEESGYEPEGFEVDPALQAKLDADMKKYNEILDSLGVVSPEREAQITAAGDSFKKQLLDGTQTTLEQSLIDRGLRGSSKYSEDVTDLIEDATAKSLTYKEDLFAQDEATKMNMLAALQNGVHSDYVTQLQRDQLANSSEISKAQLDAAMQEMELNNYWKNKDFNNNNYWNQTKFDWEKDKYNTSNSSDSLSTYGPAVASVFGAMGNIKNTKSLSSPYLTDSNPLGMDKNWNSFSNWYTKRSS